MLHTQSDHNIKTVYSFGKDHLLAMSVTHIPFLKLKNWEETDMCVCVCVHPFKFLKWLSMFKKYGKTIILLRDHQNSLYFNYLIIIIIIQWCTHTHTQTCVVTPTLAHQTLRFSNATW